jgi:hypothetical protein
MLQRGVLRRYGNWDYTLIDLASGTPQYLNKTTGEVRDTPPDEVKAVMRAEERRPVYEPTPHKFVGLKCRRQLSELCICCKGVGTDRFGPCPLCDGETTFPVELTAPASVQRVDLWCGSSDSAFLLLNLLSPDECDDVIQQAEHMGFSGCGYNKKIRVTDRVVAMGVELGEVLFERAKPFLADVLIPYGRKAPDGVPTNMLRGLWQPVGLNPCFRCCRYDAGGIFLPHFDGGFDEHDKVRSIKTFMIYLNDDFEGGCTRFYSNRQAHYRPGKPEHQIHSLRPTRGSCVVFNHCITHDGEELLADRKYILRSEVMFQHVSEFQSVAVRSDSESDWESNGKAQSLGHSDDKL